MSISSSSMPTFEQLGGSEFPMPVVEAIVEYSVLDGGQVEEFARSTGFRYRFSDDTVFGLKVEAFEGFNSFHEFAIVDFSAEEEVVGVGSIAQTTIGGEARPPYVGYTETLLGARNGRGTRRLRVMNNLAQRTFNLPLHSDPVGDTTEAAKGVWLKLVEAGEAEIFEDNGFYRYRFLH